MSETELIATCVATWPEALRGSIWLMLDTRSSSSSVRPIRGTEGGHSHRREADEANPLKRRPSRTV